ncbi:MAG: hypothetical protein JWM56_455 [Candidatus Peribacteria bacterium]|nr:hypothetical protein [Candidatus Peribacteria bacterium]
MAIFTYAFRPSEKLFKEKRLIFKGPAETPAEPRPAEKGLDKKEAPKGPDKKAEEARQERINSATKKVKELDATVQAVTAKVNLLKQASNAKTTPPPEGESGLRIVHPLQKYDETDWSIEQSISKQKKDIAAMKTAADKPETTELAKAGIRESLPKAKAVLDRFNKQLTDYKAAQRTLEENPQALQDAELELRNKKQEYTTANSELDAAKKLANPAPEETKTQPTTMGEKYQRDIEDAMKEMKEAMKKGPDGKVNFGKVMAAGMKAMTAVGNLFKGGWDQPYSPEKTPGATVGADGKPIDAKKDANETHDIQLKKFQNFLKDGKAYGSKMKSTPGTYEELRQIQTDTIEGKVEGPGKALRDTLASKDKVSQEMTNKKTARDEAERKLKTDPENSALQADLTKANTEFQAAEETVKKLDTLVTDLQKQVDQIKKDNDDLKNIIRKQEDAAGNLQSQLRNQVSILHSMDRSSLPKEISDFLTMIESILKGEVKITPNSMEPTLYIHIFPENISKLLNEFKKEKVLNDADGQSAMGINPDPAQPEKMIVTNLDTFTTKVESYYKKVIDKTKEKEGKK